VKKGNKQLNCPVESTLRVIEGRWKVLILYYLLPGTKRFNELHRLLKDISHRTLTRQLRELERDGIVERKVHAQIPPRVDYSLTKLGESIRPVLKALHDWGQSFPGK
jgi:DNA-binding HxlR family transcriptional regulator